MPTNIYSDMCSRFIKFFYTETIGLDPQGLSRKIQQREQLKCGHSTKKGILILISVPYQKNTATVIFAGFC